MARQVIRSGNNTMRDFTVIFIESADDLNGLPQLPNRDYRLGSIATDYEDLNFKLTSSGWEAMEV